MKRARLVLLLGLAVFASAERLTREVPADGYRAQYGYVLCRADAVVHPTSTAETSDAIKTYAALAAKQGKALKIRMSRNLFHSSAAFPCPNQELAMPSPNAAPPAGVFSVALLNDKLNGVIAVYPEKHQMRVGPGMDMKGLFAASTAHGMSVQLMTLPFFQGLTLGGILATASHGTGDKVASALADMVVEAVWVDAAGKVHTSTRDTPETFRALNGGLGLMGAITELVLQLTPPTNTALKTLMNQPDDQIYDVIKQLLVTHPHILIFWRPDMKRFSAFLTSIAPPGAKVTKDAYMALLPDTSHQFDMSGGFRAWQSDIHDTDPMRTLMCSFPPPVSLVQQLTVKRAWARRGDRFGQDLLDVVGPTNQMQAAECDDNCLWNGPQFKGTAQDAEFTIEWDGFKPWIDDVKAIFYKDLWRNGTRADRCQGAGYLWLRFGKGTDDYIATTQGMKRPVYLQSTWLRSTEAWQYPMRYGYVPDLIEQMTLCKYGGRPHVGKNWDRTFTYARCPVRPMYPLFDTMLGVVKKYDPKGVFEPPLWSKLVKQENFKYYPGCATDYECYCDADEHCSPDFKCVPSYALPEFKVCKPPADWNPQLARNGVPQGLARFLMPLGK